MKQQPRWHNCEMRNGWLMQYGREEVRDMNLYGEILKTGRTPCLALERSFVEKRNLADMRCELKEGAKASEIGKEAPDAGAAGLWARRKQLECGGTIFSERAPDYSRRRPCGLPVAEFGARVGFLVTVVDDRLSFANPGRFPMAERGGDLVMTLGMRSKNSRFRRATISVSLRADTAMMRTACG
ncbi:MAG: hypothetical protein ACLR8P_21820 [Clostridium fessum]